jgi:histone acetyltransferase SAS3
MKQRSRLG